MTFRESKLGSEFPHNSRGVLLARDRILTLLRPLLGGEAASERANNIAQVLMFIGAVRAEPIVADMLRDFDLGDTLHVAEEVVRAWHGQVVEPLVEVRVA